MATDSLRDRLDHLLSRRRQLKEALAREEADLSQAEQNLDTARQSLQILQALAKEMQESAHHQIASVVSRCLLAIFGDEAYEFRIDFRQARGKTEAVFMFVRDGKEVRPSDVGGGVVDVVGMALRLAALLLTRPPSRRLLVLDEPFRFLSRDYRPRVRALFEQLSQDLNIQILMVTHADELAMGHVVRL